jgi:multiple sugar transport system permease protein
MAVIPQKAVGPVAPPRRRQPVEKLLRDAAWKTVVYALLFAGGVIFVAPFAWMITASLQDVSDMFRWPPSWIPNEPSFKNYTKFLREENLGLWFFNSAYVSLMVTVLQLFLNSLAAYTFAKRRFPGRDFLFMTFLGTIMIPGQVLLIPSYIILKQIPLFGGNDIFGQGGHGWLDSYWGLIAPGAVSTWGIFWMRMYMKGIPDDLVDAAKIDGSSEFRIYWQIILPLSKAALAASAIGTFTAVWNDWFWPLIVTSSDQLRVLPLGLALYVTKNKVVWDVVFAGSILVTLPVLIMFLLFQRQILKAVALSGIK